jgi:hypothetical protein
VVKQDRFPGAQRVAAANPQSWETKTGVDCTKLRAFDLFFMPEDRNVMALPVPGPAQITAGAGAAKGLLVMLGDIPAEAAQLGARLEIGGRRVRRTTSSSLGDSVRSVGASLTGAVVNPAKCSSPGRGGAHPAQARDARDPAPLLACEAGTRDGRQENVPLSAAVAAARAAANASASDLSSLAQLVAPSPVSG